MKDELVVFIRIALYMVAGRLVAGGWLPEDIAAMVASPEAVEAATGLIIGFGAILWYAFSKARAALMTRTTTVTVVAPTEDPPDLTKAEVAEVQKTVKKAVSK